MKTAVVLGGTGMIGRAVVRRLREKGWHVIVVSRGQRDPANLVLHRGRGLESIPECDALVDVVAFDDGHGAQLLSLADRVGSVVVISSASVYADEAGKSLDEAGMRRASRTCRCRFPRRSGRSSRETRRIRPARWRSSARVSNRT